MLDLSVDGFWNSFFAIVVALPPLVAGWVPMTNEACGPDSTLGARIYYMVRLGIVDISAWVLPLALLAAIAGRVGIRDRYVHYVVAGNWGSALLAWFMLPAALLNLFLPGADDIAAVVTLCLFIACLVLAWRLTNASLAKGPMVGTGVFAGMLAVSFLTLLVLQGLLGIAPPLWADGPAPQ